MRAPGAAAGLFAMESAMDELAYLTGVDPVRLRFRNYSEEDQTTNTAWLNTTFRWLAACWRVPASSGRAGFLAWWPRRIFLFPLAHSDVNWPNILALA